MTFIDYNLASIQPALISRPEWGVLDADFDDVELTQTTVQFPAVRGLTTGQRKGYDASWFRVRGDRHSRT